MMSAFYRNRGQKPRMAKAEALRQAQLALLRGQIQPPAGAAPARGTRLVIPPAGSAWKPFPEDPKAPYAHPYYWAPFVLVGNWR